MSGKYSLLDHTKQSAADVLKTVSKTAIKKYQKQLVIWLVIKLLVRLQRNRYSETVTNEHDKEIPNIYICIYIYIYIYLK